MDFTRKITVITGGTSGIGLSIVKKLLTTDIEVIVLFELETSNSIEVFNQLQEQYGKRIDFYSCDVTNISQLEGNFDKVLEKYKALDILINNAGVGNDNNPARMIDINYKAVVMGSLMMIDRVGKHKGGNGGLIINIASIAGLMNTPFLPIYCSTKHAVVSFTRSMKGNFDKTGVQIIACCPGLTDTGIVDDLTKGLDFVDIDETTFKSHSKQSPEYVSSALVDFIIGKGKSGDVWIVENSEPPYIVKAVENYKDLRVN